LISKNSANKLSSKEIESRKKDLNNIDKSRGWIKIISKNGMYLILRSKDL
jgi:hypothetical protein